jgi:hypothetical protein
VSSLPIFLKIRIEQLFFGGKHYNNNTTTSGEDENRYLVVPFDRVALGGPSMCFISGRLISYLSFEIVLHLYSCFDASFRLLIERADGVHAKSLESRKILIYQCSRIILICRVGHAESAEPSEDFRHVRGMF